MKTDLLPLTVPGWLPPPPEPLPLPDPELPEELVGLGAVGAGVDGVGALGAGGGVGAEALGGLEVVDDPDP